MYFYYRQASNILRFYRKEETDRSLFLQEEFGLYSIFGASLEKYDALEIKGSLVYDEDDPINRFYVLLSIFLLKFQDGYLGWIDSDR